MNHPKEHYFHQFPWAELQHAYGNAANAPQCLFDLMGDDEDKRDDAWGDFLFSSAVHQYTTYTCTPAVVLCALHMIEHEPIDGIEAVGHPLKLELLQFIGACRYGAQRDATLKQNILSGESSYQKLANDPHTGIAQAAQKLVDYCQTGTPV